LKDIEVSIVFVNDKRMTELNKRYRNTEKTTDVLSFPMFESNREFLKAREESSLTYPEEDIFLGEIIINPYQVKRQASLFGNTFWDELLRVTIHGLLHLLGYDHEKNPYQARKMKERETFLFNAIKEMG
jgi:probable rRNA maturation factor